MRPVVKGSTDQSVVIRIIDSTDGTPETAVEHDTAGIDLWYRREGAVVVSLTEAALASADAAHADGGIEHLGDGYYRLDLPDAAFATGADGVMVGGTVTGMIVIGCYVPLVNLIDGLDPDEALAIILAPIAGKASRPTADTIAYRDQADTKARVTLVVDSLGNRTASTVDGS